MRSRCLSNGTVGVGKVGVSIGFCRGWESEQWVHLGLKQ